MPAGLIAVSFSLNGWARANYLGVFYSARGSTVFGTLHFVSPGIVRPFTSSATVFSRCGPSIVSGCSIAFFLVLFFVGEDVGVDFAGVDDCTATDRSCAGHAGCNAEKLKRLFIAVWVARRREG